MKVPKIETARQHKTSTAKETPALPEPQSKRALRVTQCPSSASGEDGIRTRGGVLPPHRFSKPALSATQPPLRLVGRNVRLGQDTRPRERGQEFRVGAFAFGVTFQSLELRCGWRGLEPYILLEKIEELRGTLRLAHGGELLGQQLRDLPVASQVKKPRVLFELPAQLFVGERDFQGF